MRAVRLHTDEGVAGLALDEVPTPEPAQGEALVRVHAAAITRDELTWPVDRLPATVSYEVSGVVERVGEGVDVPKPGDAVYALTAFDRDGAAADYVVVPAVLLAPKPSSLSHVESAALPMGALSAWQGLFDHGGLDAGGTVAVLGMRGGVGHLAVQLARARGAEVVEEGAEADLVFDTTGGARLRSAHGRVVTIAEESPGATYFVVEPSGETLAELTRLADAGDLRPEIDSVFEIDDAQRAFERLAERGKRGKVVLRVRD